MALAKSTHGVLVLTRKVQEKIIIQLPDGQQIEVTLVETAHGRARIGFKASKEIGIWRAELVEERA